MLLAAGHGDFWSGNLLLDKDSVGVIDWEHFRQEDFPFEDLFFFSIAYGLSFPWKPGHRADSQTAFRATYLQATPIADQVRSFLLSYCNATGLATELLELFFPVFLARRALDELGPGSIEEQSEARFVRSRMWRNLFRIYAERSEPACFIDRRRKWRGMPCARSC
jgi:Ser/Thr protein kinase RdoA (MazF antagonist)